MVEEEGGGGGGGGGDFLTCAGNGLCEVAEEEGEEEDLRTTVRISV